jgi:hypothetical protein
MEALFSAPGRRSDVEARTGLVISGVAAVTVSVAVVTAVALANTMALADSPGTTVASSPVMVPAAADRAASPDASAEPADAPSTGAPGAEVVEAPAPVVVAPPSIATGTIAREQSGSGGAASGGTANPPSGHGAADFDEILAAAKASGSWDALRTWAAAQGWSSGRLEALIARLDRERLTQGSGSEEGLVGDQGGGSLGGTSGGSDPQRDLVPPSDQKQKPGPATGADRPAGAGSNVGHGNGAGHGGKRDQPRDSPDRRG